MGSGGSDRLYSVRDRILWARGEFSKAHKTYPTQLFIDLPMYVDLVRYYPENRIEGGVIAGMEVHVVPTLKGYYVA